MPIKKSIVAICCPKCDDFVFSWWQNEKDEKDKMCLACWSKESPKRKEQKVENFFATIPGVR